MYLERSSSQQLLHLFDFYFCSLKLRDKDGALSQGVLVSLLHHRFYVVVAPE